MPRLWSTEAMGCPGDARRPRRTARLRGEPQVCTLLAICKHSDSIML